MAGEPMKRIAFLVASALSLATCTTIPAPEIETFGDAFAETRAAGNVLLDRVEPFFAALEPATAVNNCGELDRQIHPCFDPALALGGLDADPEAIAARRAALDVVADYSQLLADFAAGKTVADSQARIESLIDASSTFLTLVRAAPLLDTVSAPLLALTQTLSQGLAAADTRTLILDARGAIGSLLDELEADTPLLYDIYRVARLQDVRAALAAADQAGADAARADINAYYDSLTLFVILLEGTKDAHEALADAATAGRRPTVDNLRVVMEQAIQIRNQAEAFWIEVRKIGD